MINGGPSNQATIDEVENHNTLRKTANLFALQVAMYRALIQNFGDTEWIPGQRDFSLAKPFSVSKMIDGQWRGCNVAYQDVCVRFDLLSFDLISLKTMGRLIIAHRSAYEHLRKTNNTLDDNNEDLELNITVDSKDQIELFLKIIPADCKIGKILLRENNQLISIPTDEYVKHSPVSTSRAAATV